MLLPSVTRITLYRTLAYLVALAVISCSGLVVYVFPALNLIVVGSSKLNREPIDASGRGTCCEPLLQS